jgi:hypothetical protein
VTDHTPITVAALYVRPDGPYANRPDVDLWDEARDARLYDGPHPVAAHPPCERWGNLWWSAQITRAGRRPDAPGLGDDGGCFKSALANVRRWGGVIEHPEGSRAWEHFGLPRPEHGAGWVRSLFDAGWACSVDQGRYGHKARKRSWLYYVGDATPPELDWAAARPTAWVCCGPGGATVSELRAKGLERLTKTEAQTTPVPFAELLLSIARGAQACLACGGPRHTHECQLKIEPRGLPT